MAKATTTIRQSLNYQPQYAHYFAENAALFNRVVSFYFDCIQAHAGILALRDKSKNYLTAGVANFLKFCLVLLETRSNDPEPSIRVPLTYPR